MKELGEIKDTIQPHEILFVADAMLGQDAVKSAQQFHQQLGFNGFILTKMDGDARGGAALSIKQVTGQPVKFVGTGEKYDALELFHPDRLVSRIMGMGDIMSLIEKAEEVVDKKQALELQEKIQKDNFTMEDFRDQLRQMRKLGSMEQILGMLPSIGPFKDLQKAKVDEKELVRIEAIINSMTPKERRHHQTHQRKPPEANCEGQRNQRSGRESASETVRPNSEDDEGDEEGFVRKGDAGDENAPNAVLMANSPVSSFILVGFLYLKEANRLVAIRMARIGSKKRPYYRIVVIEKRRARNGRFLEVLGQYNPIVNPAQININGERALYWLSKGAEPSETVASILRKKEIVKA